MLSNLPRILSCIGHLWQMSGGSSGGGNPHQDSPANRLQRQKLLEFVSPISHHHGVSLLAAVSVAWVEKKKDYYHHPQQASVNKSGGSSNVSRKIIPECAPEQLALVDLISSVRVLPPDTLVQLLRQVIARCHGNINTGSRAAYYRMLLELTFHTCWIILETVFRVSKLKLMAQYQLDDFMCRCHFVFFFCGLKQVLKQPLPQAQNRSWRLEVGLLHFFHAYLRKINRTQLGECWGSLLTLMREITSLSAPPVLFAGLVVFG